MNDLSLSTVIKWIFIGALYLICGVIGLTMLFSIAEALISFASTGIGALILLFVGWRVYLHFKE